MDETVTLRALTPDDLEAMLALEREEEGENPHVPARQDVETRARGRISTSGRMHEGRFELAIEAGGRLVGTIQARQPKYALPPGVYELGLGLFAADRGRGLGRQAVEQFTDLLVRDHDAGRVQASTALDNAAMRRVLERLGYGFEGVLRGFFPAAGGGREDYAMYGVTRADWLARS